MASNNAFHPDAIGPPAARQREWKVPQPDRQIDPSRRTAMIRNFFAVVATAFALLAPLAAQATDVNRASQAELESVKGIGPGLSGKILKAREAGSFKDWADLVERVGGVGPGNAARLSANGLTVGGTAFDAKAMPAKPVNASKTEKPANATKPAA
jgi:competence protein ComEA